MNALEIITIGLPFCGFKVVSGLFFHQYWLVALGILDLIINIINFCSVIFLKKRSFDACFISFLIRILKRPSQDQRAKWQDFGNAIDVLLSFILVALMIGGGGIKEIPSNHLIFWNIFVIMNVIGAGYGRLLSSISNLKSNN